MTKSTLPGSTLIAHMHQRTLELVALASEAGDEFLEYVFRMALRHLEDEAGIGEKLPSNKFGSSNDPAIAELTAALMGIAKQRT